MKIILLKIKLALLSAGAYLYEYMKNGGRFY
jgi:hypothetical protein